MGLLEMCVGVVCVCVCVCVRAYVCASVCARVRACVCVCTVQMERSPGLNILQFQPH